jgi:hypothetical protein
MNTMEQALRAYLSEGATRPELTIHYHIGNSFSGETELRLRGDGAYELWSTVTQGRQRKTYSGTVEVSRVEELVRKFLEVELWNVRHLGQKRAHDDPEASIGIEINGERFAVALWVSEISQSPAFSQAQQELLSLARDVSAGEVLEQGR